VRDLPRVLAPGGGAFFECDPSQAASVDALLRERGLRTRIIHDLTGAERVVAGYADARMS
jgi:methylase of polypeptide subunit release factors